MRPVTDPQRLALYAKRYEYEWGGKRYCELVEVKEDNLKVTIKSRYLSSDYGPRPQFRRNTLSKYLCVGGPLGDLRVTSVEVFEGYTAYNNGGHAPREDSNIYVWYGYLSSSAKG